MPAMSLLLVRLATPNGKCRSSPGCGAPAGFQLFGLLQLTLAPVQTRNTASAGVVHRTVAQVMRKLAQNFLASLALLPARRRWVILVMFISLLSSLEGKNLSWSKEGFLAIRVNS